MYDILSQQRSGKLACEIPFILSNHKDLSFIAEQFNIPFYHIPVTKENKKEAKGQQLVLLSKYKIDSIVLACYMQILSSRLVHAFPNQIIKYTILFFPHFLELNHITLLLTEE